MSSTAIRLNMVQKSAANPHLARKQHVSMWSLDVQYRRSFAYRTTRQALGNGKSITIAALRTSTALHRDSEHIIVVLLACLERVRGAAIKA